MDAVEGENVHAWGREMFDFGWVARINFRQRRPISVVVDEVTHRRVVAFGRVDINPAFGFVDLHDL